MDWTPALTEQLKTLWAEGLSGGIIAKKLGAHSRNCIIGKVHRLKLPKRTTRAYANRDQSYWMRMRTKIRACASEHPKWTQIQIAREVGTTNTYVSKVIGQSRPKQPRPPRQAREPRLPSAPRPRKAAPLPQPEMQAVPFLDRRSGQCAWPLWAPGTPLAEMTCCGNKCPPEPNPQSCEFHAKMSKSRGTVSERNALYGLKRAA